jgi:carbamoyltransferase
VALTILGLSGAVSHDPSAALYIDGKLVAAAEEERFLRDKHAKGRMPFEAAKFCLDFAGIKPADVDAVAIPFAPISIFGPARWHYARRYWYAPDRGLDALFAGNRRYHRYRKRIEGCLQRARLRPRQDRDRAGRAPPDPRFQRLPLLGLPEKTAILGIDGKGEYATTFFGYGENGRIHKIKEFFDPIRSAASTARSPNTSASRCSTANTRSWAWRPTATRRATISRAWRSSRTANWWSTPTTPT